MEDSSDQQKLKKKRWKGGRPRKSPGERRSEQQNARLTLEESRCFKAKARTLRLRPCDLARRVLLGLKLPKPVPELNQQAWKDLVPLANDLRWAIQLVKFGRKDTIDQSLLENLFEAVRELRRELRGDI
ncbi:MAG: hypothetical protein H0U54_17000 [Acidobacteria bacterium]|nr:hypothetical protein [Acidobacteriota bacterium]